MRRITEPDTWWLRRAFVLCGLIFVVACESTPRNLVVLLPEADGKVGEVTIKTPGGSTTLKTAGSAAGVEARDSAPGQVFQIGDDRIKSIFSRAIQAQPDPPATFTLYFYSDQVRMKEESEDLWPMIVEEIRRRKSPDIGLIGHTDRYGPAAYNEPLSRRRAGIIRRRLEQAGVDATVIDISWHGEKNPLVQTPDGVREPRNRRVEVIVR